MKKKLSEGRESKRQALLRKKKEEPAAFWTYVVLRFIVILILIRCIPVSYTHLDVYKRQDLARCMSLNVDRVWLRTAQGEVLVPVSQIQPGDAVVVRAGGIVPVDGLVLEGEVTVNQAVSYTHLDVYKRQELYLCPSHSCAVAGLPESLAGTGRLGGGRDHLAAGPRFPGEHPGSL